MLYKYLSHYINKLKYEFVSKQNLFKIDMEDPPEQNHNQGGPNEETEEVTESVEKILEDDDNIERDSIEEPHEINEDSEVTETNDPLDLNDYSDELESNTTTTTNQLHNLRPLLLIFQMNLKILNSSRCQKSK